MNYQYVHAKTHKATSPKLHVVDKVRIIRKNGTFEKGFTPNWTEEVFTISSVKANIHHQHIPLRIHWENQFKGPFTNKSCNRVYRKFSVSNEYSIIRKTDYLSSGKVTATRSIRGYHYPTLKMDISKQYAWQTADDTRENTPLLPGNSLLERVGVENFSDLPASTRLVGLQPPVRVWKESSSTRI